MKNYVIDGNGEPIYLGMLPEPELTDAERAELNRRTFDHPFTAERLRFADHVHAMTLRAQADRDKRLGIKRDGAGRILPQ